MKAYNICQLLALICGLTLLLWRLKGEKDWLKILIFCLSCTVIAFVSAGILKNLEYNDGSENVIVVTKTNLSFLYCCGFFYVYVALFAKKFSLDKNFIFQKTLPSTVIILAVQKIGCTLNGCCGGHLPLLSFVEISLIESIAGFAFLAFILFSNKKNYAYIFLFGFMLWRFLSGFCLDSYTDQVLAAGLTAHQMFALIFVVYLTLKKFF